MLILTGIMIGIGAGFILIGIVEKYNEKLLNSLRKSNIAKSYLIETQEELIETYRKTTIQKDQIIKTYRENLEKQRLAITQFVIGKSMASLKGFASLQDQSGFNKNN